METKIPLYNVLNMFLTGFAFVAGILTLYPSTLISIVTSEDFLKLSTIPEVIFILCFAASSYEIGLILNRIGSIVVEPILIRLNLITFSKDYLEYSNASKKNPMLSTLSREYALSMARIVEFLILAIWGFCRCKCLLGLYIYWHLLSFYFHVENIPQNYISCEICFQKRRSNIE